MRAPLPSLVAATSQAQIFATAATSKQAMNKHILLVLTNAVVGREDEFNRWYDDIHIPDLLKIPEIVSAQRFRLSSEQKASPPFPWQYLALYEIETNDLNRVVAVLKERAGTVALPLTDALQTERIGWYFDLLTPRVTATTLRRSAS